MQTNEITTLTAEQQARAEARAEAYDKAMKCEPTPTDYELVCLGEVGETSAYLRITDGEINKGVLADAHGGVIECADLEDFLDALGDLGAPLDDFRPVLDRLEEWLPTCPACAAKRRAGEADAGPPLRDLYAELFSGA